MLAVPGPPGDAALRRSAFTGFGVALSGTRDDGHGLRALLESARRSVATAAAAHLRLLGLPEPDGDADRGPAS
ncbi:hypothetical protein [Streptomyces nogalater]|uniref:Uncharacterized protein n=1 Tax=Streptomyces nogalater TaxID=38314 RepID=A0ABW0WKV4_STRNO